MSARLAVAHEWLAVRAGSEKTFEAMAQSYPDADLYALTREPGVPFDFGGRPVTTTFLDRSKALRERRQLTLPMMPLAWRTIATGGDYDKVLTSSHACVKAFPPARAAEHFCYCHAPMRYAWNPSIDSRTRGSGAILAPALAALRRWDLRTTWHVDHFAANSTAVRDRIRRFYDRDAVVIHPPVDTDWYVPPERPVARERVLAISRFVPYKRLDLAIAGSALAGMPITVAGSGPAERALRRLAEEVGADARFEISPSDERLRELYQQSHALVFAANEDFGIVPVEAQACGTPVVALDLGGARDTVLHGETGLRIREASAKAVAAALTELGRAAIGVDACRRHAESFSIPRFQARVRSWMGEG